MPTTLRILSWNVEKFSDNSRFRSPGMANDDFSVLDYIYSIVSQLNLDIICFIEPDITAAPAIRAYFGSMLPDYTCTVSPGVRGGMPVGGAVGNNEVYIVLSRNATLDVLTTAPYTPQLVASVMPAPASSSSGPPSVAPRFTRDPLAIFFAAHGQVTPLFYLFVVHLGSDPKKIAGRPVDLDLLLHLATQYQAAHPTVPGFVAGDFNNTYEKIIQRFALPANQDSLSIPNGRPLATRSTQLAYDVSSIPAVPPYSIQTYRLGQTGIDDIISMNNGGTVPQSQRNDFNPFTGINDLLVEYFSSTTVRPRVSSSSHFLDNLDAPALIRNSPAGNVDYSTFIVPVTPGDPNINNAIFYNGWARYMGGISDHLPVIMTIDIP